MPPAPTLRSKLAAIQGIADLQIEKQVLAPQIKVRVDYARAAQYGVPSPRVLSALRALGEGALALEFGHHPARHGNESLIHTFDREASCLRAAAGPVGPLGVRVPEPVLDDPGGDCGCHGYRR
jgi:hypothetical protein